jgi:hypothetical protein
MKRRHEHPTQSDRADYDALVRLLDLNRERAEAQRLRR